MGKEESTLKTLFGDDAEIIKSSEWDDGEYIVNGKPVTIDIRCEKTYYEAFYKYYDYVDIDEYRISWEKEEI